MLCTATALPGQKCLFFIVLLDERRHRNVTAIVSMELLLLHQCFWEELYEEQLHVSRS